MGSDIETARTVNSMRAELAAEREARARLEAELAEAKAELVRQRAAAGAARAESEARYRALFEDAADAILVADADSCYLDVNRAATDLLGYSRNELLRMRVADIVANGPRWTEEEYARFRRDGRWRGELEVRRKDGVLVPVESRATPVPLPTGTVYLAALRDISARRAVETRLREESETLATVNHLGGLLSAELDLPRLVQAVTDAATELTGAQFGAFFYNIVDEQGERYTLYTLSGAPTAAFAQYPMPRATALFGPTFRGEGVVRLDDVRRDPRFGQNPPYFGTPAGHLPVASYLAVPVVSRSGAVLGGLFFGHEQPGVFTERAERVVTGLAAQAAVAMDNARLYQQAQEAIRARDQFLSIAAHELRTPIAGIRGYVQLLRRGQERGTLSTPTLDRALRTIDEASARLTLLTSDLLDVSRIRLGQLPLRQGPLDLAGLVTDVVGRYREHLNDGRHRLIVEAATVPPVPADRDRVEQVLTNLLDNALKYSPGGGEVRVTVRRDGEGVLVAVRDEGIGLPPDAVQGIFEPFGRAPNATRQNLPGLGLGLYICRSIVERHGGRIWAESPGEGRGTTINVWLPVAPRDE